MSAIAFVSVLAAVATAVSSLKLNASSTYQHPSNGICTDYVVTQNITSTNYLLNFPDFQSNFDVASLLFNLSRKDYATAYQPFAGTINVTKEYEVGATFCTPNVTSGRQRTILVATHGVAFDRRYWASTYQSEEYSFVDYVLAQGYSIVYYDRVGTGRSRIVDGYLNQDQNQIEFLGTLVRSIDAGHYTSTLKAAQIVLVGHSLGSYITNSLIAQQPNLPVSAIILTGFAYPNTTDAARFQLGDTLSAFPARIASSVTPQYSAYGNGYLALSLYGLVQTFFNAPYYDTRAAEYAYSVTTPFAVGEPLTFGILDLHAPQYTGPVLITTGINDGPLCGGECTSTFEGGLQKEIWNGSSKIETYLHEGVGHGINFGRNASGFFEVIGRFLDDNV